MDVLEKVAQQLGLTRQDAYRILSAMFSRLGISSFEEEDPIALRDVLSAHLLFMKNISNSNLQEILVFDGKLSSHQISKKETKNIYLFPALSVCPICKKPLYFSIWDFSFRTLKYFDAELLCLSSHLECNYSLLGYYHQIAVVLHTPRTRLVSIYHPKLYESEPNAVLCYHLRNLVPFDVPDQEFSDEINQLSPSFSRVYNESLKAELHGLTEVAGGGYRKALEFLIKDFCISLHPNQEEEIKSKPLAKCIEEYVQDINIKEAAKRAAWLGNDQLHYLRRWTNKDIDDLKKFLAHTVKSIEHHLETLKIIQTMPEHKRS